MTPRLHMVEKDLQNAIVEMAQLLGWRVMHTRAARTKDGGWRTPIQGHSGFPDLVLLRPPRLVFAELKTDRGHIRQDQALWLNGLNMVPGVEQYLWQPRDWELGQVEEVLR